MLPAVILACRDVAAGGRVAQEVEAAQKAAGHPSHAVVQHLDLSDLKSVKDCASRITASQGPLHILVNNAGVYDMSGASKALWLRRT
jgi:NAD(P)-dependent dehydrogenase (short-subunit alcohol dehydrogenase family)